jgi:hypothetical protein
MLAIPALVNARGINRHAQVIEMGGFAIRITG